MQEREYQNSKGPDTVWHIRYYSRISKLGLETLVSIVQSYSVLPLIPFVCRGCVTPKQISNLKDSIEGDPSQLDGYDELPEDVQEKLVRAIEQGHIDDEDWGWVVVPTVTLCASC